MDSAKDLTPNKKTKGKDEIIKSLFANVSIPRTTYMSTGSLIFDDFLSGGIPSNCPVCIVGEPQSGKTSLIYMIIGQAIRDGKRPMLVATEGKFDVKYLLRTCGLDENMSDEEIREYVWVFSGNNQQEQFDRMLTVVTNRLCDIVLLDSISAFVPEGFVDSPDSPQYAAATKANNHFMRVMPNACEKNNIPFVFTAQYRTDVFAMSNMTNLRAERKNLSGGTRPIMYGSGIVLEASAVTCDAEGKEKRGESRLAYNMTLKAKKAQLSGIRTDSTASTVIFVVNDSAIIDSARECVELGDKYGLFAGKDGKQLKGDVNAKSIRFYNGQILGNRKDAVIYLRDNHELRDEIYNKVREAIIAGNGVQVVGVPKDEFDEFDGDLEL